LQSAESVAEQGVLAACIAESLSVAIADQNDNGSARNRLSVELMLDFNSAGM
jgi:hypothetical protein